MRGFKSIFVSSKHKINCFLIQEKYFQTANAVDTLPLNKHKYDRNDLGWPAEHISKTCDVIRGVNIDQSEDSLVNLTNQQSDCENSNSGQEASHNIV